jgi:hypothetical protein
MYALELGMGIASHACGDSSLKTPLFLLNTILGKSVELRLILALRMAISPAILPPFLLIYALGS